MQKNLNARSSPLWRKIMTIAFLPLIILIWTTSWVLTQIGPEGEPTKNGQKALCYHPRFEAYEKRSLISDETDEDPKEDYEQKSIA